MHAIVFTPDEVTYILNAVDQAVRAQGLAVAQMGLSIAGKLQIAVQPPAVREVPRPEEPPLVDAGP